MKVIKMKSVILAILTISLTGCASGGFNTATPIPASSKFSQLKTGMKFTEVGSTLKVKPSECKDVLLENNLLFGVLEKQDYTPATVRGAKCEYKAMGTLYFAGVLDGELVKIDYNPESTGHLK